jgi:hypothetical protein
MGIRLDQLRDLVALGLDNDKLEAIIKIIDRPAPQTIRNRRCIEKKERTDSVPKIVPPVRTENVPITVPSVHPGGTYKEGALTSLPSEIEVEEKKVRKRERGNRITEDWWPSEIAIARVKEKHGFTEAEICEQADQLRNHFLAKTGQGATSTNWDLNFYNWMARQANWRGNGRDRQASAQVQRANGKRTIHEVARDLYQQAVLEDECSGGDGFAAGAIPRLREG